MGVTLFVFSVQKPGPIDERHGMENAIVPPSEFVKRALVIGDVVIAPIPIVSGISTFAMVPAIFLPFMIIGYGSMLLVKRVFLIAIGVFLVLLVLTALVSVFRSDDVDEPAIRLETYTSFSGTADNDGDGVPNWLEEITDSDALNADSFPYDRDVVRAERNTADTLLYDGPGDFTEEIVQRFLFDVDGSASITEDERQQFVDESVAYFLDVVDKKGLPDVVLTVDDGVSREVVLSRFVSAMRQFSDAEKPIDVLVFDVFSKDASVMEVAREARGYCDDVLRVLPREVPQDVYASYHSVLERVTYLCEALTIALTSATAENFFYVLRLMSAGTLFEGLDSEQSSDDDSNVFVLAVAEVVQLLQQQP